MGLVRQKTQNIKKGFVQRQTAVISACSTCLQNRSATFPKASVKKTPAYGNHKVPLDSLVGTRGQWNSSCTGHNMRSGLALLHLHRAQITSSSGFMQPPW